MKKELRYHEKFIKNAINLAIRKACVLKKKGRSKKISDTDQVRMLSYILNLVDGKPIIPINGRTTRPLTSKEITRTIYLMKKILDKYDFIE